MKIYLRLICVWICVIGFDSVKVQLNAQGFQYFDRKLAENDKIIGFNLNQSFGTNSLTSSFVLDFVHGKFISNEAKDRCIANFKSDELLVGEQLNLGFNYQRRLGSSHNFLYFELGETFFYESSLHPDIFVLLFKGNKSFENETASLNPLRIRTLQYFYFKGGLHRITEQYSFKVNVAYTGGQRLLDLKTQRGTLFTATDGRYIDLNLGLESYDVNPANNALFTISGNGMLSDFTFTYNLTNSSQIGMGVEGLGFIKWDKNVTSRIVDTSYHYEGVEISNVLDSFSIAVKNVEDLKSSFIKENRNVQHQTNLPFIAYLQYSQFLIPEILQVQLKYGIIKSELTKPFLNSAINWYLSSNKLIGCNVDAGGYGKVNIGAQFAFCFSNKSSIHLYFHSISNLIIPSGEMNFTGGMIYRRAL